MADEATDLANSEQLLIFIDGGPCEMFPGFLKCESGVTGETIADDILLQLVLWHLQAHLFRRQIYDRAGTMAGYSMSAAAHISARYPKAVYIHCSAHRLNLCIMKACSIQVDSRLHFSLLSNLLKRLLALENWVDSVLPEEEGK